MGIKSCAILKGQRSDFFVSENGLRQSENLSPILFSFCLNDLEEFMIAHRCNGVEIECTDDDLYIFTKLLLLFHADDTAILAENEVSLKYNLDQFLKFCKDWKLCISYAETKVLIFGARNIESFSFSPE